MGKVISDISFLSCKRTDPSVQTESSPVRADGSHVCCLLVGIWGLWQEEVISRVGAQPRGILLGVTADS